jgi:hypothetical protein
MHVALFFLMTDAKLVIFLEMFVFLAENNIKTPLFSTSLKAS